MKTKKDFKELNFNEYAFFKGVSTLEAKWIFSKHLFTTENIEENLTKTGTPKIKITDTLNVELFDFTMRSNSALDGKCQMEYLCDYYNNGIPIQKLRDHSQNKTFIKAKGFTGVMKVANDILNPNQLSLLTKTWNN